MRRLAPALFLLFSFGCSSDSGVPFGVGTETACNDGRDSDKDGLTDCQDPDCVGKEGCPSQTTDGFTAAPDGSFPLDDAVRFDTGCGGEFYQADAIPPNVLIMIDRSGSMNDEIGNETMWNIARDAVNQLLASYEGKIRFGLLLYPGFNQSCSQGERCEVGDIDVGLGDGKEGEIRSYLRDAGTCSFRTPISAALQSAIGYAPLQDADRNNYVLLMTDGEENCDGDPVAAVTALRQQTEEVKTFVVGFGSGVDGQQLNQMADAAGTALSGDPRYYQADDAAALSSAFNAIAGSVLSCSYTLSEEPPDANRLYVYFNKSELPRDTGHNDGWDYDATSKELTFYGSACDRLKAGEVQDLQVVFGCRITIE